MKRHLVFISLAVMLVAGSCKKDNDTADRLAGFWIPYESKGPDNLVHTGAHTANGIFGAYSESVQIFEDHSFIPITFFDKNHIQYSLLEKGTWAFTPFRKLIMKGPRKLEFSIERLNADEMWLDAGHTLYKFRKQP